MTALHHDPETADLDQLAATYRFLALITELRARALTARRQGEPDAADHLETEANFLSRQLPVTPPLCGACGSSIAPRPRRPCVGVEVTSVRERIAPRE